jgi:hypothetical protein
MARIKKAQKGVKASPDSTAYYDKLSKKYFDEASSVRNAPYAVRAPKEQVEKRWKKEKTLMGKGFEAQDNSLRQIRKGKPGYDKNGFPIKKQRSGGKIKPKASNVSKKLGSAKKSIGNMRFTKKKK